MIDHQRKLLFIHIARTGGTSVEAALVGRDWWEQDPQSKHLSASQTRAYYGEEVWNSYFKFSIVRNPFDRLVSMWAAGWWHTAEGSADPRKFHEFLLSLQPHEHETYNALCYHEILDLPVDRVLRFERLEADFTQMLTELGHPEVKLPHVEKRDRADYRLYYDDVSTALVRSRFAQDLQTYGYEFEPPTEASTTGSSLPAAPSVACEIRSTALAGTDSDALQRATESQCLKLQLRLRDAEQKLAVAQAQQAELQVQLESKDADLQASIALGERLRSDLDSKHSELGIALESWKRLDDELKAKEAALGTLHQQAQELQETLQTRHEVIQEQQQGIRSLKSQLQNTQKDCERAHRVLAERDQMLAHSQQALQARQQRLQEKSQALQLKHEALHQSLANTAALQAQLQEKEAFLQGQAEELRQTLAELHRLRSRRLWERIRNAA